VTYTLHIPGQMPCLNDIIDAAKGSGGRGYGYSKMKKQWTMTVWGLAKQARLPHMKRARFSFHWHELNRLRNKDNIAAARKFILDGLVLAKVLDNDGWKQIADDWHDTFTVDKRPGVTVTMEEVE
jgi:hypothetical protein